MGSALQDPSNARDPDLFSGPFACCVFVNALLARRPIGVVHHAELGRHDKVQERFCLCHECNCMFVTCSTESPLQTISALELTELRTVERRCAILAM